MNDKDRRLVMALLGAGLIAGGHKLMNEQLGELGAPHAVGAVLLALALRS
jgi:hypothetical protein